MLDTYSLSNISCLITKAWTAKIRPRDPHWKKKYRILLIKLTLSEIRRWTENINWSLYISGIHGHRKGQKYIWTKSIVIWFKIQNIINLKTCIHIWLILCKNCSYIAKKTVLHLWSFMIFFWIVELKLPFIL